MGAAYKVHGWRDLRNDDILNFGKMSITLDWIKIFCIKLYGKMHHGHAEMTM